MSWWKHVLIPAALLALVAVPAHAQIAGHPFEVSVGAGINSFDAMDHVKDALVYQGSFGYRWSDALTFEAAWLRSNSELDLPGEPGHDWSYASLDMLGMLRDPAERSTPYLLVGFGLGRVQDEARGFVRRGAPSFGLGFRYNLAGNSRSYLRLQARDVMVREPGAQRFSQQVAVTAGLTWVLRGRVKDQDLDGVRNGSDQCPNTPIGARVDAKGCPVDSDGDGVFDGLDQCPDSPRGASVDAKGCPLDSDGDGVADGVDQCPNTPAGAKVNARGCPEAVSPRETELLDTGTIRLQNINFDVNKATIKAESYPVLDEVAHILLQYPALTIEIGGHTDNSGLRAKNMALSEARAKSVLNYLVAHYPTLDAAHFSVRGYGPTVPLAPNTTAAGKARNRRVEFKVTNTDELRLEREKRHGAPADTTGH